ncbi:MAG TPA: DUF4198 domain-containing protein [bacterium]|nr:DUF4198 domain-containing protein [bacterium]
MRKYVFIICAALICCSVPALAHFQVLIPSKDIVGTSDSNMISLDLMFIHPFEGNFMNMAEPTDFGVMARGKKTDLIDTLKPVKKKGFSTFTAQYSIKRPGDHIFYVSPAPYWEPAEDCYIIHYTKVIVSSMGMESGWDSEIGLKTEIVPLTRPYGLWTGNLFRGIVKLNGKAVPGAEIEVEYYNPDGKVKSPADPFITQVIKADGQGVFAYAMPKAGWWAFAALSEDDKTMKGPDGKEKSIEIGAVIWVHTVDMD